MSNKNHPTPNDQRSTVKNPTSPQYAQDQANQAQQGQANTATPTTITPTPTTK